MKKESFIFTDEETMETNLEYESRTQPRGTGTMDGKYNYMPLGSSKPCIFVKSCWPNVEWRTMNSNILSFIAKFLVSQLMPFALITLQSFLIIIKNTIERNIIHY